MKRIFGLILLVLAMVGAVNAVKRFSSGQGEIRTTGNAAYDSGQKAGRMLVPVVLGGMGLLGLWLLFSGSDYEPARPAPVRRAPAVRRPPPGNPSLRGGQDTFASNPALLRLNAGQWLAANPLVMIVPSVLAIAGLIVLLIKVPVGIALVITAAGVMILQVREAKQKFYRGDVCPGVVLSAQGDLVAIFTDLKASSNRPQPAIKILKQPLARMRTEAAYDGMRVAAAAFYHGRVRQPAWRNFSPEVIDCVVHDPVEIARVLGSIDEADWQTLDACLAQVPVAAPGLYRLSNASVSPGGEPPEILRDDMQSAPPQPWFKTAPGIFGLSVFGVVVGVVLLFSVGGAFLRLANRRDVPHQGTGPIAVRTPPNIPRAPALTQTGPYTIGASVQAQWADRWIPGQITSINSGGFSVMVKLQDPRFSFPIVLPTNQIRLR